MLTDGYRVLSGTLTAHHRDNPNNFGKWFHVHLTVAAQGHNYDCAVDVDSHQSNTGVEWKVLTLWPMQWGSITSLSPGLYPLANTATSGALDYIRDPRLIRGRHWRRGDHVAATNALEEILEIGRPVYVFGERFHTGFGVHNIHQNQGDPIGSQWASEDGIWQDGGTVIQRSNGSLVAFISKFTSQSYRTDNQGRPV